MSRIANSVRVTSRLVFGVCLAGFGCTHLVETNAINSFMLALETQELDQLKSATSGAFERKALRLSESIEDLNVLKLPEGKGEILHVQETVDEQNSTIEKHVTVEIGETKRKLKYKLIKEPNSKRWVVDDVYMKQTRPGLIAAKSVTEQMNLLLTVREFFDAWHRGSPAEITSITTPEFGQELGKLPANYLVWLARKTVGNKPLNSNARSSAQMDEEIAIVRVPVSTGEMTISFRLQGDLWKVSDVAIDSQSQSDRIASARELAKVITVAVEFLDLYKVADKQKLAGVCTQSFYRGSLMPGDLSIIRLPDSDLSADQFEVDVHGRHSDFIVKDTTQWIKISVENDRSTETGAPTNYLVDDVAIYELDSRQEKRLSALFTSQAMVQLFSEALISRNLTQLRHSSTPDFNRRVWQYLDQQTIHDLPLHGIESAQPRLISTDFRGVVSEVWVTQGQRAISYMLHDQNGQLLVDDIHISRTRGLPSSLKTTLELMLPVMEFARGIKTGDLNLVRSSVSKDFDRLVWQQVDRVPDIGHSVSNYLAAQLESIQMDDDHLVVVLGDETSGAKASLVNERDKYVIDEIQLIAGPDEHQRVKLKHSLRFQVVNIRKNSQRVRPNTLDASTPYQN